MHGYGKSGGMIALVAAGPVKGSRNARRPAARRARIGRVSGLRDRRGLTLVELLMASAIMALIAGGVAALAVAVQRGNESSYGRGLTLQHGRVAIERIERALRRATASDQFPGFTAFAETVGTVDFPDTLVVWHPDGGTASDPGGLPLMNELVVFCPEPGAPARLLEIRVPTDFRPAPPLTDTASWQMELDYLKNEPSAQRVVLTDLIRVAAPSGGGPFSPRGAVRFEVELRPSNAEWTEFQGNTRNWEDISWPQDIYAGSSGLRQTWCRIELQLRPGDVLDHSPAAAVPFFGSAAVYYSLFR